MDIFYVLWDRNSKFCVWMHLCIGGASHIFFWSLWHCDILVKRIPLILFELGISNMACGWYFGWRSALYDPWVIVTLTSDLVSRICILRWRSVVFLFGVTVTLNYDIVSKIIVSLVHLLIMWGKHPKFCVDGSWDDGMSIPSLGHCDLDRRPSF